MRPCPRPQRKPPPPPELPALALVLCHAHGAIIRTFLEEQLRHGRTSCWDPLLSSRLEFTATDMSFLLGQSTAFDELRQAISDACDPPVVDSFLGSLSVSSVKINYIDMLLQKLSNMRRGAYRKGETGTRFRFRCQTQLQPASFYGHQFPLFCRTSLPPGRERGACCGYFNQGRGLSPLPQGKTTTPNSLKHARSGSK